MAFKFQTKFGSGWFAIEADSLQGFEQDLVDFFGQAKSDAIIAGIAGSDPTAVPERAPARSAAPASGGSSSGGGSYGGGQRAASEPPADWKENPPSCDHGPRRARQWERNNKQNYTWYCDLPQDRRSEQCTPIDAATGKEWGSR